MIELVLNPSRRAGYHVYAPDLPGLHTQGEDIDDASRNAEEALALYVEGLREDGRLAGTHPLSLLNETRRRSLA